MNKIFEETSHQTKSSMYNWKAKCRKTSTLLFRHLWERVILMCKINNSECCTCEIQLWFNLDSWRTCIQSWGVQVQLVCKGWWVHINLTACVTPMTQGAQESPIKPKIIRHWRNTEYTIWYQIVLIMPDENILDLLCSILLNLYRLSLFDCLYGADQWCLTCGKF